jgi:hypothetical protein
MRQHGILDTVQARDLCAYASQPFVTALTDRIASHAASPQEAARVRAQVDDLRRHGRLSDAQARQIHDCLAQVVDPQRPKVEVAEPPRTRPPTERQRRQLAALAALQSLGAMSETTFEAERARILSADS